MSIEKLIDSSKEIFKLDKDILSFKINLSNSSSSEKIAIDEIEINVTNLTDNYLAFQTKTTKKVIYAVNPPYCIIAPNENKKIKIIMYNVPGEEIDSKDHKFKFEGFIILENEKDKDAKTLFNEYAKKGNKVVGNIEKRKVKFIFENNKISLEEEKVENLQEEKIIQSKKENNKIDKENEIKKDKNLGKELKNNNTSNYLFLGGGVLVLLIIAFYFIKK